MEYCELGDLSGFIKKRKTLHENEFTKDIIRKYPSPENGGLHEVLTRHFLKQIASGLQWIRKRDFLHRDIKPQNLLLVPSKTWQAKYGTGRPPLMVDENIQEIPAGVESIPMLKIADFGFARFLPSLALAETLCGSPLYMAPEILRYEKYDAKADLWSTGTVVYEMVVGRPPFRAQNHVELLKKIDQNKDKIRFPVGLEISEDMQDMIRGLLKRSPAERLDFARFFEHPILINGIPGLDPEDEPQEQLLSLSSNLASRMKSTQPSEVLGSGESGRRTSLAPQDRFSLSPKSRPHSFSHGVNVRSRASEPRPTAVERQSSPSGPPSLSQGYQRTPGQQATPIVEPPAGVVIPMKSRDRSESERPRTEERTLREIRDKADQDIAFERDVVFVDKSAVEYNALADAFDNSPEVKSHRNAVVRRTTSSNSPYSTTAPQTSSRPWPTPRQAPSHGRQRSLDKQLFGRSPSSATSAITKALNMANFRMFSIGGSPPTPTNPQSTSYTPFSIYTSSQGSGLLIGNSHKGVDSRDEDMRIATQSEKLAHRSSYIFDFAEVKYQQLIPVRPIDIHVALEQANRALEYEEDEDLTVDAIVTVAEEALVLYVHVLGLLSKVFDVTGQWFNARRREQTDVSPRSAPVRTASVAPKINSVVQWARKRFNECLEKSEFVARKLVEAQGKLPQDHPGHPNNHHGASSSSLATNVAASADNITLTSGVTAEKLMYDRAVEMSRTAAINELTNEDLEGGERSYRTAIHLLEAVLDDDERDVLGQRLGRKDDEIISGLEMEDRKTVEKRKQSTINRVSNVLLIDGG